jgi:hypothetical protein
MRKSQIFVVCLSFAVGYIAAIALNRTSAGQPPLPAPVGQDGHVWRYQLMGSGVGDYPNPYATDTITGRVWVIDPTPARKDHWHALGSPDSVPEERK